MDFLKYNIPFELDSKERTIFHRQIILHKPFLKRLYKEWYQVFINEIPNLPEGMLVELGSGGGFLKEVNPSIICTDILELPTNDMTFSALKMPFASEVVSGLFMINTFHHIPDCMVFLKKVSSMLKIKGKIIMIEPANSIWDRFIYSNFHHEPFNLHGSWVIPDGRPLSGANAALPWIVFERDIEKFYNEFPNLKIIDIKYHTPFRYLLSGGVSYRQLVPNITFGIITGIEKILTLISKQFSMFVTIKIEKIK